jgi:hypothetical protein
MRLMSAMRAIAAFGFVIALAGLMILGSQMIRPPHTGGPTASPARTSSPTPTPALRGGES